MPDSEAWVGLLPDFAWAEPSIHTPLRFESLVYPGLVNEFAHQVPEVEM
jgi:hypothetical protein